MTEREQDNVVVDVCADGLWLDKTELYKLTEAARHHISQGLFRMLKKPKKTRSYGERTLPCPVGAESMQVITFRGVQIDWCKQHGVWLDAGELEAILHNIELDRSYLRSVAERLEDSKY